MLDQTRPHGLLFIMIQSKFLGGEFFLELMSQTNPALWQEIKTVASNSSDAKLCMPSTDFAEISFWCTLAGVLELLLPDQFSRLAPGTQK